MYSLVIPIYNEQEVIISSLSELFNTVYDEFVEIILVDDGSKDQTHSLINDYISDKTKFKLIIHEQNLGLSSAINTGSISVSTKYFMYIDSDGQVDPSDIKKMVFFHKNNPNYHLISGIRVNRKDSFIKNISSKIANLIRRTILKDTCLDNGCCIKLFERKSFLQLPFFINYHRYFTTIYERKGYQVYYINVNHRKRIAGKSKFGMKNRLWVGLKDLIYVYKILKNEKN